MQIGLNMHWNFYVVLGEGGGGGGEGLVGGGLGGGRFLVLSHQVLYFIQQYRPPYFF